MSMMRTPEMDVIRFKEADVIVASGGATKSISFSNFNDDIANNSTISFNGKSYLISTLGMDMGGMDTFREDFNAYFGTNYTNQEMNYVTFNGVTLASIYVNNEKGDKVAYNGTFTYTADGFIKQ